MRTGIFSRLFLYCGFFFGVFQALESAWQGASVGEAIFVGVGAGLFFGLFMAAFGTLMHKRALRRRGIDPDGPDAGVDARESLTLPLSPDQALGRCRTALEANTQFGQVRVDPASGMVLARARVSWASFGEKIECRVQPLDGSSQVEIRSRPWLSTTLIDYGKNRENVRRIRAAAGLRTRRGRTAGLITSATHETRGLPHGRPLVLHLIGTAPSGPFLFLPKDARLRFHSPENRTGKNAMKKLKLTLADLEVSSFAAQDKQDETGTVDGLQISQEYYATGCMHCSPTYVETQCGFNCTQADGCYPSYYCSDIGPGMPNASCGDGCMTDAYAAC